MPRHDFVIGHARYLEDVIRRGFAMLFEAFVPTSLPRDSLDAGKSISGLCFGYDATTGKDTRA